MLNRGVLMNMFRFKAVPWVPALRRFVGVSLGSRWRFAGVSLAFSWGFAGVSFRFVSLAFRFVSQNTISLSIIWLTIHVTNQCLKSWHDFKKRSPQTTYVAILNAFLAEKHAILILEDCEIIEQHLRRLASAAKSNLVGKKGNPFVKRSRTTRKIAIRRSELKSMVEVERELTNIVNSPLCHSSFDWPPY